MCVFVFIFQIKTVIFFQGCNLTIGRYSVVPRLGRSMINPVSSQQVFIKQQLNTLHYANKYKYINNLNTVLVLCWIFNTIK